MGKGKLNKIFISIIAAAEVLTLFPVIYFTIIAYITAAVDTNSLTNPVTIMGFAMIYMFAVLFCAYKAIQNIQIGIKAYSLLAIPLIILIAGYLFKKFL